MPYTRQNTWEDSPSTDTPIDAAALNGIEDGIEDATTTAEAADAATTAHIADIGGAHAASAISVNSATLVGSGVDVQASLEEIDDAIVAASAATTAHVSDSSAAHAASAISVSSTTLVGTGTDAQAVFEELDNAIVAAETATSNHLADSTAAHAASAISYTAGGTVSATDVQAAIAEVASEADTRLDALESTPPGANGGATITVAAVDAPAAVIARADYVCDGVADEVQINAALALYGKVSLSDGIFVIDAPIKMEMWGGELEGAGMRYTGTAFGGTPTNLAGTLIRPSASFTGSAVVKVERHANSYIVGMAHVHGFSIDGQLETVETYDGILFRSFRGSLHDVDVQNCTQDGIKVIGMATADGDATNWATYDTRVYSINCSNNGRYGLHLVDSSCQDTHVSQAILEDNLTGLYLGGASHQIVSMHSYGNTENGILSDTGGGARTKFIGCKIEHSGEHGVLFTNNTSNPVQVQFIGCNFSSNGETTHNTYDHISLGGTATADLLTIAGCTFATTDGETNIARYAIYLANIGPSCSITGNTINDDAFSTGALYITAGGTTERTLKCFGNQEIQDFSGSGLSTATIQAGAGTSPPSPAYVVASYSRNHRGSVTWGTGTTTAAGGQVAISFPTNEIPRPAGSTAPARVMVTARNIATANLNPYVSAIAQTSDETTGFTIALGTAPTDSQANTTYAVDWVLVP